MSKHMRFFQNSPSRKQILSPFRSFNPLCSQNTDKVSVSTNCQIAKKLYNTSLFPKIPISFGTMFHRIILVLVIYTRYIYIYKRYMLPIGWLHAICHLYRTWNIRWMFNQDFDGPNLMVSNPLLQTPSEVPYAPCFPDRKGSQLNP